MWMLFVITYDEKPLPAGQAGYASHLQDAISDVAAESLYRHVSQEEDGESFRCFITLVPSRNGVEGGWDEARLACAEKKACCYDGSQSGQQYALVKDRQGSANLATRHSRAGRLETSKPWPSTGSVRSARSKVRSDTTPCSMEFPRARYRAIVAVDRC